MAWRHDYKPHSSRPSYSRPTTPSRPSGGISKPSGGISKPSAPSGGGVSRPTTPSRPSYSGGHQNPFQRPGSSARPSNPAPRPVTPSAPSGGGVSRPSPSGLDRTPANPSRPGGLDRQPARPGGGGLTNYGGGSRPSVSYPTQQTPGTLPNRDQLPSRPSVPALTKPSWLGKDYGGQTGPGPAQQSSVSSGGSHAGEQRLEGSKYYIYKGGNTELDAKIKPWSDRYMEARSRALAGDYNAVKDMLDANDMANQIKNKYGYAATHAYDDINMIKAQIGYDKNEWAPDAGKIWYPGMPSGGAGGTATPGGTVTPGGGVQGGGTISGGNVTPTGPWTPIPRPTPGGDPGGTATPGGAVTPGGDPGGTVTPGGGVNDYSDYIKQMNQAAIDAQIAEIEAAWKNAQLGYDHTAEQLAPGYQAARNQAAAQAELAQRQFGEYAAASGLSSGAGAQAELSNQAALQGALSDINVSESAALAQVELQRQQSANKYQSAISEAKAGGNLQLAQQLYQEAVRVDTALREQARYAAQMAMQQQQLQMQQQQQALDNAYRDKYFAWQAGQQDLDNAYRDKYFAWQTGQQDLDNAYRDKYFAWQTGQSDKGDQQDLALWLADHGDYQGLYDLGVPKEEVLWLQSLGLAGGTGAGAGMSLGQMVHPGKGYQVPGGITNSPNGGIVDTTMSLPVRFRWETDEQYQQRVAQMMAGLTTTPTGPMPRPDPFDYGHMGGRQSSAMDRDHPRVWGPGSTIYDLEHGIPTVKELGDLMPQPDWYLQEHQLGPYAPVKASPARRSSGGGGGGDDILEAYVADGTVPTAGPLDTEPVPDPGAVSSFTPVALDTIGNEIGVRTMDDVLYPWKGQTPTMQYTVPVIKRPY